MPQLNVAVRQHGQICVLSVSGELDVATAPILAGQAAALHGLAGRLIVDLSGLEFVDCKGAQALATLISAAPPGCPVLVRGLAGRFRKIFDVFALPLERHGQALPLERHGQATLDRVRWARLESQVLRAWAQQARADSQALRARSRQARDRAVA